MHEPKILVGAPIYSDKKYISPYWIEKVMDLSYPNYDVLVVDNSKYNENFGDIFIDAGITVKHSYPHSNPFKRLLEARKLLNKSAIEGGYDYLFSIEQDIIVPKYITEILLEHNVPIVGAPYVVSTHTNEHRRIVDHIISGSKLNVSRETIDGVTIHEWYLTNEIKNKGLIQVKSCSLGCTLINTEVLKKISVRGNSDVNRADDSYFFQDCYNSSIPVYLDCDLMWKVEHIKRLGGGIDVGREIKKQSVNDKLEVLVNV